MRSLTLASERTLKLTNVVAVEIGEEDFGRIDIVVEKLDNLIKSKGYTPIGPLIQFSGVRASKEDELSVVVKIMRQASNYISHIETPYVCEAVWRVKNCMYVRYTGPETMLKFAYDKINLTAFEEDIKLKGDSYTVFVNQVDDDIIADVFMERADEE